MSDVVPSIVGYSSACTDAGDTKALVRSDSASSGGDLAVIGYETAAVLEGEVKEVFGCRST
jgi:hypothetical protein